MPAAPQAVSFPTQDGGVIYADEYGTGERAVVLAHGIRFNKESWKDQATHLAASGFRAIAIDFRGYGKSHGGPNARPGLDDLYLDVLGAVRYARETGAKTVVVVGGSMGGFASANAAVQSKPGEIDRLVLLANPPIGHPERIALPTLFATSEGDSLAPQVRDEYAKASGPKELLVLPGSAHAQNIFATDQGARLMQNILRFISETGAAAH